VLLALGRYARKYRFLHPTPEDLLSTFGEVLGPKAVATMRTALFDKGWVDYVVASVQSSRIHDAAGVFDHDGKRETIREAEGGAYQGSVLLFRRGTLSYPVNVELTLEDGSTQRLHWDGDGESVRLPYSGSSRLRAAVVDPDNRVLLDQSRTNNFAAAPGSPLAGAPRTTERLVYWAELLLQGLLP
jgi:hypothetical protein